MMVQQLIAALETLPPYQTVYIKDDTDSYREILYAVPKEAFDEGYGPEPQRPIRDYSIVTMVELVYYSSIYAPVWDTRQSESIK